jgi:hypothetical protein
VTAPLHLRGPAAASIAADYAEVHRLLTTFLLDAPGRPSAAQGTFGTWLRAHSENMDTWSVRVYDAVAPAPTLVEAEQRIGPGLEGELRQAHGRDPSAPIFQPSELLRLVGRAIDLGDHRTSVAVAEFAAGLHPRSVELQALRSEALEASGHRDAARTAAAACASMPAGTDWRAAAAASRCRARSERLSP